MKDSSEPPDRVGWSDGLPSSERTAFDRGDPSQWPHFLAGQIDKPVRVLLIEDDPHMRRVVAQEMLDDRRIDLLAQGACLRDGRRLTAQHDFDVLLVDLHLGDGTGFELLEVARAHRPLCETVMLSSVEDEDHAVRAFELGATGFLVKNSWFGSFSQAVLQVANGGSAITPSLMRRLIRRLDRRLDRNAGSAPQNAARGAPPNGLSNRLSERERDILRQVAQGHTSLEIGRRLEISGQTVNTHIRNIYRKMQVRSRAQAVTLASRWGVLY